MLPGLQRQPIQLYRLLYLPVSQFDFQAMAVQVCHFCGGVTHRICHRRQQVADFPLRIKDSRRRLYRVTVPASARQREKSFGSR